LISFILGGSFDHTSNRSNCLRMCIRTDESETTKQKQVFSNKCLYEAGRLQMKKMIFIFGGKNWLGERFGCRDQPLDYADKVRFRQRVSLKVIKEHLVPGHPEPILPREVYKDFFDCKCSGLCAETYWWYPDPFTIYISDVTGLVEGALFPDKYVDDLEEVAERLHKIIKRIESGSPNRKNK
jgi:hypothetical protein